MRPGVVRSGLARVHAGILGTPTRLPMETRWNSSNAIRSSPRRPVRFPDPRKGQASPRRAAIAAASRRFSAPSLPMMLATWNSTVRVPMKSWSAISGLE